MNSIKAKHYLSCAMRARASESIHMYYFDMTDILIYVEKETSVSGIQRVSFEVIRRMVARLGPENVRLSYWDRGRREYVALASDFVQDMDEFSADDLSAVFFLSLIHI